MSIKNSNSKLRKVACYLKDLLTTKPDSRIVIFVRTIDQEIVVSKFLNYLNLSACDLKTFNETNSPAQGVKIFILVKSSINLASHLRSVSHFLILQQFFGVRNVIISEIDGMSTITNDEGQNLKVVRFVLKDTIEETLLIETQKYRENMKNQ